MKEYRVHYKDIQGKDRSRKVTARNADEAEAKVKQAVGRKWYCRLFTAEIIN